MAGRVSYCFFCGSAGPAGGTCQSCLVPIGNPYAESAEPLAIACPRCRVPLVALGIAPGANVHACGQCHGVLASARAWCTLVTRPDLAQGIHARLPARAAPPGELVRMLQCPVCRTGEMERGRFGASSNIVIDVCTKHGIWLDAGEIAAVVQHAQYRATVGAHGARRALDQADERANPHFQAARNAAESARFVAQSGTSNSKKGLIGGVGVFAIILIARLVFYAVVSKGQPSPSHEVENAGESAGAAATALGAH